MLKCYLGVYMYCLEGVVNNKKRTLHFSSYLNGMILLSILTARFMLESRNFARLYQRDIPDKTSLFKRQSQLV